MPSNEKGIANVTLGKGQVRLFISTFGEEKEKSFQALLLARRRWCGDKSFGSSGIPPTILKAALLAW